VGTALSLKIQSAQRFVAVSLRILRQNVQMLINKKTKELEERQ
jgi:hypothetical protein